jgi:hypothetical protein
VPDKDSEISRKDPKNLDVHDNEMVDSMKHYYKIEDDDTDSLLKFIKKTEPKKLT